MPRPNKFYHPGFIDQTFCRKIFGRGFGFFIILLCSPYAQAQNAVQYLVKGSHELKKGYFDQAIIDFTKALDKDPNLAKAYNNRGVAYAKEGSFKRAISDFTMAIANNSNDAEAYNNRGHAYAKLGDFHQAIHDYTKAIKINAFYDKAYNNRANAYYELKEYEKAWADVEMVKVIGGADEAELIQKLKYVLGK